MLNITRILPKTGMRSANHFHTVTRAKTVKPTFRDPNQTFMFNSSLFRFERRGFLKDEYKQKMKQFAKSTTENAKKIGNKVYENMPDKETTKSTLKSASQVTSKAGKQVFNKLSELAKNQKENISSYEQKQSGTSSPNQETKRSSASSGSRKDTSSQQKSGGFFNTKKEDIHSLPGKVSFLGKFFAFVAKTIARVTKWFSRKIFGRLFTSASSGIFRAFKDRIVTKALLLLGGLISLVVAYKSLKKYVKGRKFRKKDQEIEELKNEIRVMKDELNSEIKYLRQIREKKG
ncbi:unnamed protein product [Moneuplotes crassus]|uniref:Uncharacterized protein n=1 Tax=Euplotes crassus TaxID=5936 RepID=A0AAD1XIT0_EUPCR|nr:unnamed protein product [Moneuplotes crassus]